MPMHYPPLSDGTYRYGDPPQPLPSPEPGPEPFPDPASPFAGAQPMAAPQGQAGQTGQPGQPALPYQGQPAPPQGQPTPPYGMSPQEPTGPWRPGGPAGLAHPGTPASSTLASTSGSRGPLVAVAAIGVFALVVVVIFGLSLLGGDDDSTPAAQNPFGRSDPPPPIPDSGEFTVDGTFTVVSTRADPVSGDRTSCDLPLSLSDIGEGTTITLRESGIGVEARTKLAYSGGDLSSCTFTFEFPDIEPGGTLYRIELPGRGQLVYTEDELRAGVDITLGQ